MPITKPYSFSHYLAAKKTVDDRALNQHVWNTLAGQLPAGRVPLRVLEVGSGIGTMITRMFDRELLGGEVYYTAVDAQAENTAEARRYLLDWAADHGLEAVSENARVTLENERCKLQIDLHTADAFTFVDSQVEPGSLDLLIAHAFIDLVHIPSALSSLFKVLKVGGLFYFTINFDGITAFEPLVDPALDARIEALYHADMDRRRWHGRPTGGSRSGRELLRILAASDVEMLAAGSSDWVVTPRASGYEADEAAFLHFIIHTVETALTGHPEMGASEFTAWCARRHQQIEEGCLIYIAHQLDVLGRI